ncbi:hypothetical protein V8G54_002409, partial [Vigna mungo]
FLLPFSFLNLNPFFLYTSSTNIFSFIYPFFFPFTFLFQVRSSKSHIGKTSLHLFHSTHPLLQNPTSASFYFSFKPCTSFPKTSSLLINHPNTLLSLFLFFVSTF